MITVIKGTLKTEILEQFKERYLSNGWTVIDKPSLEMKTEEVSIIAKKLNPEQAAHERGTNLSDEPIVQAEKIIKAETKPRTRKVINTGLIKPKETTK